MMPLEHKLRRRVFWACIALFVIGTPLLIGYSKGYRLDDALSLIETGGIYIHSDMANVSVYLDDEFVEHNGAFLKNTLIQDLSPGKVYTVRFDKDGYRSWVKTLPVYANLVTEGRVLMLPETLIWRSIPATSTVALEGVRGATTTRQVANPEFASMTELFEGDVGQFEVEVATTTYTTVRGVRVATTSTVLEVVFPDWMLAFASSTGLAQHTMVREREGVVAWIDEGDIVAGWARANEPLPYYFCAATCTEMLLIDWQEPITRFEFFPNRNDVLIVASERGVYAVELDNRSQRNIQPFVEGGPYDFRLQSNGSLAVFDGTMYRETSW